MDVRTQPSPTSTPHHDRNLAAPTRFGRYVFAGEIGTGGMGVVYAAYDPELDRMVAVKLLRDGDVRLQQRLRREAQVMARLAHPNVVAIHDVGSFEGRMFIAMEYVEGETLSRWISRPHAQREILDVYCAAGRGLAAAHAAGIVHRDFKPDNVLVGHDGRVRVGDFGLACPAGARPFLPSLPALTAPGTLLGTRHYMAPELYKGVDADVRSDQFSFCVSLFTALYGERPCTDDTPDAPERSYDYSTPATTATATRDACRHDVPRRLPARPLRPRVRRRIRAALRRGLDADPAARFSSLDELLAELEPSPQHPVRWLVALGATLAVLILHAGSPPPPTPAACDPTPDAIAPSTPATTDAERMDVGKPNAAALLDPLPLHAATSDGLRATCSDPGATLERATGIVLR